MPYFSVIIPLYNKENYIQNTLKSVLSQTFSDFEVIIVNDGSTDSSLEKLSIFDDKRIKIINQENSSAATARNNAILNAKGHLLALLDADDYWTENHLYEIKKLYELFPNCGMYCSRYKMKVNENKYISIHFQPEISDDFLGIIPDYFKTSMRYRVGMTSAVVLNNQLLKNNYLFNKKVSSGQDLELFTKIAINFPVAITNRITVEYNFDVNNQLSKTPIVKKTLVDFSQFNDEEKTNSSLKHFLDLYRLEYALQFKIAGNKQKSSSYLSQMNSTPSLKSKILLNTPVTVLKTLLKIKHWFRKKGIDFSVYN